MKTAIDVPQRKQTPRISYDTIRIRMQFFLVDSATSGAGTARIRSIASKNESMMSALTRFVFPFNSFSVHFPRYNSSNLV